MTGITARFGAIGLAALLVGCGGGVAMTSGPTATAPITTPSATTSPATTVPPPATFAPAPSGHLAVPSQFEIELDPGRYWSSPPFEIGFSFDVDQPGWIAGHLNAEFFDIQRDADGGGPALPQSILGFGLPTTIRGATDIPVVELTPAEAVAELLARTSLGASNVTERMLFGRESVSIDLHPAVQSAVFGAAGGTFRIDPELEARLAFIPFEQRLLAVILLARPGDLEMRWLEALPILESIDLG